MGKTVKRALDFAKKADPITFFTLKTDREIAKVATDELGLTTPEAIKQQQRASELAAKNSAAAAELAARNLEKNQLVDLTDASNSPDVIAGGTANQLGLGGDMRKKRAPGLATQLGVRI